MFFLKCSVLLAALPASVPAQSLIQTNPPAFLGANSCSSSSCHGGGGEHQNQYLVWSLRDFHSQRPYATLTTARSKQIAAALRIPNPAAARECTSCHAPLHEVPQTLRGDDFRVSEGVSCESCHGPAEHWLRSHTRPDFTRADRVASGLRDLKDLYVRANTCVACHQTVSSALLQAGHPELIFELDGQSVAQPRHWRTPPGAHGAQAWFVGQAVALREMSWQLSRETNSTETLIARWQGLFWLMHKLDNLEASLPPIGPVLSESTAPGFQSILRRSDELARRASSLEWNPQLTRRALQALAGASDDFLDRNISAILHARRAERLVLALDRLTSDAKTAAQGAADADASLDRLFQLAQSIPDFDPSRFAAELNRFAETQKQ